MKYVAALCLLLVTAGAALAQQATEIYIPIGESPGVSKSDSIIGSITSVDHQRYQMVISVAGESRTITMTQSTRYYIDKSSDRKQNRYGDFDDCESGQRIEAYVDDNGEAVWVKIDASD